MPGTVSRALVEPYRDEAGRPRHKILANLRRGDRLAGERDNLRKERSYAQDWVAHEDWLLEREWGVLIGLTGQPRKPH
jgi:hypothetical protein